MCMCVCLVSGSPSGMSAPRLQAPGTRHRRPWVTVSSPLARAARAPLLPRPSSPDTREAQRKPLARRAGPTASRGLLASSPTALRPHSAASTASAWRGRVGCPAALPREGSAPAHPGLPAVPSAPAPCRPGDGEEGCTSGPHPARPRPRCCPGGQPSAEPAHSRPLFPLQSTGGGTVPARLGSCAGAARSCGGAARPEPGARLGLAWGPCTPGTPLPPAPL